MVWRVPSGIACVTLSFVDAQGRPLQVPAQDSAGPLGTESCSVHLHQDNFDELTSVHRMAPGKTNSRTTDVKTLLLPFNYW